MIPSVFPFTETNIRLFCDIKHPLGHWCRFQVSVLSDEDDAMQTPESIPFSELGFKPGERRVVRQTVVATEEIVREETKT